MTDTGTLPIWHRHTTALDPFKLVMGLALLFAAMRVVGTLGPAPLRFLLPLGFCLMMALPWLLLTRSGRAQVGLQRAVAGTSYAMACLYGALAAAACYLIGLALFGHGAGHWFTSIANNYRSLFDTSSLSMLQLHLFFTIPAMLFSPIGEEIFFRGLMQRALEERFSVRAATAGEAALFGLVHLCHHGLLPTVAGLVLLPLSGALWVLLMFAVALLLAHLRKSTGSLYPAMAAHAAFNLAMNTIIFAVMW